MSTMTGVGSCTEEGEKPRGASHSVASLASEVPFCGITVELSGRTSGNTSHSGFSSAEGVPSELQWLWGQRSLDLFASTHALVVGSVFTETFETRGASLKTLKPSL